MIVTYTVPQKPVHDGVYSYYTGLYNDLGFRHAGTFLFNEVFKGRLDFATRKINDGDLIHNPTSYYYLLRKQPIPTVLTIMDAIQWLYPEWLPWKLALYHQIGLRAVKRADHIITVSDNSKKDLIRRGIPEDNITTIYPGINPIFFEKPMFNQYAIEQMFGIRSPYVLYAGSFNPRKNLDWLITSFIKAKEKCRFPHTLVLAGGSGWNNRTTYELIRKHHNDVTYVKTPATNQLHTLYSYASLFVYPSLYEGFGLPLAEAMATGCPVMCPGNSSLPEVVGDVGIVYDETTADYEIFDVLKYGIGRTRQEGVTQARKFNWQNAAEKTIEVYKECLE